MKQKSLSRRDFLKVGGMAAISLPIATKVGVLNGQDLYESEDLYGGFLVRTLKEDEPPIEVDEAIYKRFDSKYVIFSRVIWDTEYNKRIDSVEKAYKRDDPGYEYFDMALGVAANFISGFDGTNSPMTGPHAGVLGLNPPTMSKPSFTYDQAWTTTPEDAAEKVKKAALFLGASLVGIAPMNEKWIYSGAYDMMGGSEGRIEFGEVIIPELPEGQVSVQDAGIMIKQEMEKLDGDSIKTIVVDVLENTDPALLPPDAPPVGMAKILPAGQFKENVGLFTSMPAAILRIFAEKLGMNIEIANVDLGEAAKPRYEEDGTLIIPETMKSVIVLAFEMDYDSIEAAPTLQGDIATMNGYSKMAITAGSLAQFIKALGYNAIPCGNNTGISVPQAIEAGLGEGGRNGILITPKYGPRVRLAKVITDMPLAYDKPIRFGLEEFCGICGKCAENCPTQAISYGEKSMEPTTISTNIGVKKWSVNAEECYLGWTAAGSGCGVCIRVCPFNKPEGWLHEATRILIGAKSGSLDSLLVKLDTASGYGAPQPKFKFWESDSFIHIKD